MHSLLYTNLGASYLGLNDLSNAILALDKAIALKTNFLWSRLDRARAFEVLGSKQNALKDYQYALLLDPGNQSARDGVTRLAASPASPVAGACLQTAVDENQKLTTRTETSSFDGLEAVISAMVSATASYNAQLQAQTTKIQQLSRDQDQAEKRKALSLAAVDDRKRIVGEVQRLNEASIEARSRLDAISQEISARESKMKANHGGQGPTGRKADNKRSKRTDPEFAKLLSARATAERDLEGKISELSTAKSAAERKAAEVANLLAETQMLAATKDSAEQCAAEIKGRVAVLVQKTDELRIRQKAEALRTTKANVDSLLGDLSAFAKRNPDLIPIEIGPLVAEVKVLTRGDDVEKLSESLRSLQKRLDEIPKFKEFRDVMEEKHLRMVQAELDDLIDTLRGMSDFMESYIRENITSDAAPDLTNLKGSVSESLVSPRPDMLREMIAKCETEFKRLTIADAYTAFRLKHPRAPSRLFSDTTPRNRYLVEWPLDETIVLVNETGRAGVVRNLKGELVFENGRASLCFPHENNFDAFALFELKRRVRDKGSRIVDVSGSLCRANDLERNEVVAVNRGLFGRIQPDTAKALLSAVDKSEFSMLGAVSDRELRAERNAESVKSLQLEGDIVSQNTDGYGLVSIANGSSVICQIVNDRDEAHGSLISRHSDRLELEVNSLPTVVSTLMETAFISAKRGQCGAIYGNAASLKQLIDSLRRDNLNYHVFPMWFSERDVLVEDEAIAARKAAKLREQQKLKQKQADDRRLQQLRDKWTDQERQARQSQLRQENGALARGLQAMIFDEVKAFAEDASDKTRVGQEWPQFAGWWQSRMREQWELENVTDELHDYGVVEWKGRVLEAGFLSVAFKMKQRELGERRNTCFLFGYIFDKEFDVARDPIVVPCENESAIEQYKVARSFSSRWFAK